MLDIVHIKINNRVLHQKELYTITKILNFSSVLCENTIGSQVVLQIEELDPFVESTEPLKKKNFSSLESISDDDWKEATMRYSIIEPLLKNPGNGDEVKIAAKKAGKSPTTIYGWIKLYNSTGTVSALVSRKPGPSGITKLEPEVEVIIEEVIQSEFLSEQRPPVTKIYQTIECNCRNAGIKPPSIMTVRNRISKISKYVKTSRRYGRKIAMLNLDAEPGTYMEGDFPLQLVQIDHTPINLTITDSETREPIGKPWITVAIDIFSRMVLGFYISLDHPSAESVGMCMAHAILPKENWLLERKIDKDSWPCWGVMRTIHSDNAVEFESKSLIRACENYGINADFRALSKPNWGGYIERYLGTLNNEIHTLPGTTFDNPEKRADYNSEKQATLTLPELEKYVTTYITKVYHQKTHEGIKMSPLAKYEQGLKGNNKELGTGLPPRIHNTRKVLLDFMPIVERVIQQEGVQINKLKYYSDIFRPFVEANIPGERKRSSKSKYTFKISSQDICTIYFYHPQQKEYYEIPLMNWTKGPISRKEYQAAVDRKNAQGYKSLNESLIFQGILELKEIVANAVKLTKTQKRATEMAKKKRTEKKELKTKKALKTIKDVISPAPEKSLNSKIEPIKDVDYGSFI